MTLSSDLTARLMGAIDTSSLVILCGAGLSRGAPSELLSAADVARSCFDRWRDNEALDQSLREDLDALAGHFHSRGDFESTFLRLVPWDGLVGPPNPGHAAMADLLITSSAHAVLTTNFDALVETWAELHRTRLRGALTAQEAAEGSYSPLLKVHGCMRRDEPRTLWTHRQLKEPEIEERVRGFSEWMRLHLPRKHIVVAGFWTDWGYLNDVLEIALADANAASITVIDPKDAGALAADAPRLWQVLNNLTQRFEHVRASAADALDGLRVAFSRSWMSKFYRFGTSIAEKRGIPVSVRDPFAATPGEALYDLRRDAEGVPYSSAAKLRAPSEAATQAAFFHVELLNAGARHDGAWINCNGSTIRIINGAGKDLSSAREGHREAPSLPKPAYCVCAGADDLGLPGRIVATGQGQSTIRPQPGSGPEWLTVPQAKEVLGV